MGHAKRWDPTATSGHVEHDGPILDHYSTQRLLQMSIRAVGGDPISGIRNAVIIGALVWIVLALASAYFLAH